MRLVFVHKKMPDFSGLLASDVKSLLTANYAKIESQSSGFKYNSEVIKTFTLSLMDLNGPFRLKRFIKVLRPILKLILLLVMF